MGRNVLSGVVLSTEILNNAEDESASLTFPKSIKESINVQYELIEVT